MIKIFRSTPFLLSAALTVCIISGSATLAAAQSAGRQSSVSPETYGIDLNRYKNAGMVIRPGRGTPTIDGELEPGEWSGSEAYTGFIQFQPDHDVPATQKTTVWVLYDDTHLYVAFDCRQPDYPIQDYILRRDRSGGDSDCVGVIIDPFLTWKEGYIFLVNPAGVQTETMLDQQGNGDGSWDTLWKVETIVKEGGGWTAEMAIPWSSLRFARSEEQTWGINLFRAIGEPGELSALAPLDIGSNNMMTSNAIFTGVQGVTPGRSIWINPYITTRKAREGMTGGGVRWVEQTGLGYMGADFKLGISSNLIMDLTLNPDFGHIEADQEKVNLTPYELFFPERRPFFMEDQQIFRMPINLFYSRRIYNPLGGAKLAGQIGSTQIGLVTAYNEPLGVDDDNPYNWQSALRLKQNFGRASNVGVIFTSQDIASQSRSGSSYQRNIGFDFDFRPSDYLNISGMAATFLEPGVGNKNNAFYLMGGYSSQTWISTLMFVDAQRDFEARLGFVPRPNQQLIEPFLGYRHEADWGPVKWVTPNVRVIRFQEHSGELIEQRIGPGVSVQFRDNSNCSFDVWQWRIRESEIDHDGVSYTFNYNSNPSGTWGWGAGGEIGDGFDYGEERVVSVAAGGFGVTWRPTVRATLSANGTLIRRSLDPGGQLVDEFAVGSLRTLYQFTRELFGRIYLQLRRDHTGQDASMDEMSRRVLLNALVGYEMGPGSVIYLVYNHYDLGEEPGEGVPDRVLFFKVAKLFAF